MNCSRHPEKRTISACEDCGAGFCIDCVRETDQTTYCYDCYRRRLDEIAREVSAPPKKEEPVKAPVPKKRPFSRVREAPVVPSEQAPVKETKETPSAAPPSAPSVKERLGRLRERKGKAAKKAPEAAQEDFLARGPDDDFSVITTEKRGVRGRIRRPRTEPVPAPPAEKVAEAPPGEEKVAPPETPASAPSEDTILKDVVSTLLKPEAEAAAAPAMEVVETAAVEMEVEEAPGRPAERADEGAGEVGEERAERWSFLAQSRSMEYTTLSKAWWRSAIFIALMLIGGALLWALPNAFLIPRDQEYGIHAFLIGIILGLAFWWKAGKKHGTKLALQAALTTFFAIILGEFLHWLLIIVKNQAFRTIFFDLISFKFLWENGPTILKNTVEAMFPVAFIWLLLLPSGAAFLIGFGMPPIPEIFFQIGRALKGQPPDKKEAEHGLEG